MAPFTVKARKCWLEEAWQCRAQTASLPPHLPLAPPQPDVPPVPLAAWQDVTTTLGRPVTEQPQLSTALPTASLAGNRLLYARDSEDQSPCASMKRFVS